MSYILEALKKSELEREQLAMSVEVDPVAGTATQASPTDSWKASLIPRSFGPYFGMVVIALLVLVSFSLINTNQKETVLPRAIVQPTNDVAPSQNEPLVRMEEPTQQISVVPVIAAKSIQENPIEEHVTAKENTIHQETSLKPLTVNKETVEVVSIKETIDAIDEEERAVVLSIEQASDAELAKIPSISITSHIYSSQAKRRSIVVNNERLVEGDFVSPQVQVQEITHQGMILKVNDSLLAVSRSRGWNR